MAKTKNSVVRNFLGMLLMIGGLGAVVYGGLQLKTTFDRPSAFGEDCGKLKIKVSTTGRSADAKDAVTIDENFGKYYLHAYSEKDGKPCSTAFEALGSGAKTETSPWQLTVGGVALGAYTSDAEGVAYIDLGGKFAPGTYKAQFRQYKGKNKAWSNAVTVTVKSNKEVAAATSANSADTSYGKSTGVTVQGKEYVVQNPGYTYVYKNKIREGNANLSKDPVKDAGKTMLQMEEKIKIAGMTMVPWRFIKTDQRVYWDAGKKNQLRWFIADSGVVPSNLPKYGEWIWALGHKTYAFAADAKKTGEFYPAARDIKSPPAITYLYRTTDSNVPNYVLMPKTAVLPSSYFSNKGALVSVGMNVFNEAKLLTECKNEKSPCPNHFWRMRVDMDTVNLTGRYKYNGPAVRVDYYEITPQGKDKAPWVLRESWYYVKGVGVVKIAGKLFNGYAGKNEYASVESDPDFYAATMKRPHHETVLDEFYNNPKLSIKVSALGKNKFAESADVSKEGYELQLNPPFTGYLEAQLQGADGKWGKPGKWLWSEKGKVVVDAEIMKSVGPGKYTAQFRVWVPDDKFPLEDNESSTNTEVRITDTKVPWSNTVVVNVK